MREKDLEKLIQKFGQALVNDGDALGIAIALPKKDSENVVLTLYASPYEAGYLLSKAVESIANSFQTNEEREEFSNGLVGTMRFINDKRKSGRA